MPGGGRTVAKPVANGPCNILVGLGKSGFGGLVVSMLASGTQDRRFEPGRRIFRAKKFTACLPSEEK
jgi:hypothetical protein